ncbi:MAG: alpha/beta hydrolase [Prevotella sp.]|nr:alpha/beta hydrolase [Prevotella sp.]
MQKVLFLWLLLLPMTGWAAEDERKSQPVDDQRVVVNTTTALLGSWSGKLDLGVASLTLVFHLEQADGYVKVTMDSPDQSVKGIPVFKDYLSDDSLAVKVEQLNLTYRARLKDDKLVGTFTQNGMSLPLVLAKGVSEVNRPQTPQPPFPYETEEVTFRNEKDGATLAGTLTWPVGYDPKSKKKPLVALFVTGSGQENRDEEVFDHKPFLVIADYLARQGIATLRYDDRATGASTGGDVKNATSEDFARDAAAGLEYLRNRKAFAKIGVLGHSEGGLIAFMLGAQGKTDFIVSLAGPGVKGDTLLTAQSNRILKLTGMPATMTVEKYRSLQEVQQVPWIKWFIDYDPSADIAATRCPVFALNGSYDCQVISSQNLPAIERLLPKSKKNLIKEYPGLNHLFQHCTTGLVNECRQIEETISPEVLSDIATWIKGLSPD